MTKWRYIHEDSGGGDIIAGIRASVINDLYNENAMQIDASVNLFAQGEVKSVDLLDDSTSDKVKVAVDVSSADKSRWVIQSYFETPMLNFNHLSASNSITLPTFGSQSVPRGMWHQYGRIETDTNKGVFLQVTDIPDNFRVKVSGSIPQLLVSLCGFKDEPKRMGQTAQSKIISEAIVAIPFIERSKSFNLDPGTIRFVKEAQSMAEGGSVANTTIDMVNKMRKFVMPPSFDFVHRDDIDPFAMYIFEFEHTLSQQDLADIWQNLPPTIGRSFEEAEATIEHSLLAHELGGGKTIISGEVENGNPCEKIRWLVFKARQKQQQIIIIKSLGLDSMEQAFEAASILRPEGVDIDVSYNWPYDFFSLVELAKIESDITLANSNINIQNEISCDSTERMEQEHPDTAIKLQKSLPNNRQKKQKN